MSRAKSITTRRWQPACKKKKTDVGHLPDRRIRIKAVIKVAHLKDTKEPLPKAIREARLNLNTRAGPNNGSKVRRKAIKEGSKVRRKAIKEGSKVRRKATKEARRTPSRHNINTSKVRSPNTKGRLSTKGKRTTKAGRPRQLNIHTQKSHNRFAESLY